MTDGSQPLENNRQEAFAKYCALGNSDMEAYRKAGYTGDPEKQACAIKGYPGVKERVAWLKAEGAKGTVLTIQEKREFLAAVVRTPIGDINETSPLCQSYKRSRRVVGRGEEAEEWETDEIKAISKTDAIKIDNDMSGDNASQKHEVVVESREDWLRRIRGRKDDA